MYLLPAVIPLCIMIRSDFRKRKIGVVCLILFGLAIVVGSGMEWGWRESGLRMVVNGIVLLWTIAVVWGYLKLRYGGAKGYVGWGDIWFLASLTPLFGLRELVGFLTVSFLLTLLAWVVWKKKWTEKGEIPLVGTVGICCIGYVCFKWIIS